MQLLHPTTTMVLRISQGTATDRRRPLASFVFVASVFYLAAASLIFPGQAFLLPANCKTIHPYQRKQLLSRTSTSLAKKSGTTKKKPKGNLICTNRLAYRNYEIIETMEAGISLKGTEVKSIRDGKMNLRDGYVRPTKDGRGCTLFNVHIGKHSMAGEFFQHEEKRPRALLVHRHEARRMQQRTDQKGLTIVPIKAYFNDDNKLKLEIALCRGKNVRDKRATIKEREAKRDERRIIKSFRI